jgi:hypothetical protein
MDHIRLNGGGGCRMLSEYPFAEGTFKLCWKAEYLDGFRRGETATIKQFEEGCVYEEYYFNEEMIIIGITEKVAEAFNEAKILGGDILVRVSRPVIATSGNTGAKALVEPYIEKFEKFNSNSGWVNTGCGEPSDAMQALSEFSYHGWGGEYVLCDLQGGVYQDGL